MKLKDKQLLGQKSPAALETDLKETMASLAKTKMEQKINKIKNVRQQAELRNKIAVLKTIMGQKS